VEINKVRHAIVDEYDPNQPRAPKGDPDGGKWTSEGGGSKREGGFVVPGLPGVFYSQEEYKAASEKQEAELKKTTFKTSKFRDDDNGEKVTVESWKADNRGLYRVKIISPKYGEYSGLHREDSRGDAEYKAWFVWNSTKTGKISWGDSAIVDEYDPNQPRKSKGDPDGGKWTKSGAGGEKGEGSTEISAVLKKRAKMYNTSAKIIELSGDRFGKRGLYLNNRDNRRSTTFTLPFSEAKATAWIVKNGRKYGDSSTVDEYNPNQPRAPKGDPDGGQWTSEGGSGSSEKPIGKPTEKQKLDIQAIRQQIEALVAVNAFAKNPDITKTINEYRKSIDQIKASYGDSSTVDEYNPNQPRAPKGDPDGGQWTSEGGSSGDPDRPASVKEEHLRWLNSIRESGQINMFGAGEYLRQAYPELNKNQAREVLSYWMKSFGGRQRALGYKEAGGELKALGIKPVGGERRALGYRYPGGDSAMMMFDAVTVDASRARWTKDGYVVAEASVARTGVQLYTAAELGMDGDPDKVIRVYRPPEEVFSKDAMASYAHRPVTVDHPGVMVDASNWKQYAKGQTGDEVVRDGDFVRVPLMLLDADAISEWKNGRRELSMGYTMDLKIADGVTDDGQKYDAVQTNLRMNHLALVSRARGGSQLRLGDTKLEDRSMDVKLTTITVDGLSVETTDAGVQAIFKLNKELVDTRKVAEDSAVAHAATLAAKDKELATKDAEIDLLKGKVLSDANLDKMVKERADLISVAKQVADKDYTGMAANDIRKAAVVAQLGQAAVDGKSEEYITARFDILAEDANQDPVRKVLRTGDANRTTTVDQAHAGLVQNLENAWKQTKEVA